MFHTPPQMIILNFMFLNNAVFFKSYKFVKKVFQKHSIKRQILLIIYPARRC